jgi:hypothetical protein
MFDSSMTTFDGRVEVCARPTRPDPTRPDPTRSRLDLEHTFMAILPTCVLLIKPYKKHRETHYDTEPPVYFAFRISRTTNHE